MKVVAIVPTNRSSNDIGQTLIALVNQTVTPERIIIGDQSEEGILNNEYLGWLCNKLDIEVVVVKKKGRTYNRAILQRYAEDTVRGDISKWSVWSVDDDAVPFYDCLEQLRKTKDAMEVGIVAARVVDVLPVAFGFGWRDFVKNAHIVGGDTQAVALRGTCFLYNAWQKLSVNYSDRAIKDIDLGEDIYFSTRMAWRYGAAVSGKAFCLHARIAPQPYLSDPLGKDFLVNFIKPEVSDEWFEILMQTYGFSEVANG